MAAWLAETGEDQASPHPRCVIDNETQFNDYRYQSDPNAYRHVDDFAEWIGDWSEAASSGLDPNLSSVEFWLYPSEPYAWEPNDPPAQYNLKLYWSVARALHDARVGAEQPDFLAVETSYGVRDWDTADAQDRRRWMARVFDPNVPSDPNQADPNNADLELGSMAPVVWFTDQTASGWYHRDARRPLDIVSMAPGYHPYLLYFHAWNVDLAVAALMHCKGDMNCDSMVTWQDTSLFASAISNGQSWWETDYPECSYYNGDFTRDGYVTWQDINPFVAVQNTTCTWPPAQ